MATQEALGSLLGRKAEIEDQLSSTCKHIEATHRQWMALRDELEASDAYRAELEKDLRAILAKIRKITPVKRIEV